MKKILKWSGIILGTIVLLVAAVAGYGIMNANSMLSETMDITPETISLPTDSASLARGEYLAYSCRHCHGSMLEGKLWFGTNDEELQLGAIWTNNLTKAPGSKVAGYTDADWVRTLRHGINPEKRMLFVMPATDMAKLSERDLGSLIAYLKQVEPVENQVGQSEWKPLGKILLGLGVFGDVFHARNIDHKAGFVAEPTKGPTKEWGAYFIGYLGCVSCHGVDYAGGVTGEPGAPLVPAINASAGLGKWTSAQFIQTMRSGITPEEKILNARFMPFTAYGNLTDDDLTAVFEYLRSMPPQPQNTGRVKLKATND